MTLTELYIRLFSVKCYMQYVLCHNLHSRTVSLHRTISSLTQPHPLGLESILQRADLLCGSSPTVTAGHGLHLKHMCTLSSKLRPILTHTSS